MLDVRKALHSSRANCSLGDCKSTRILRGSHIFNTRPFIESPKMGLYFMSATLHLQTCHFTSSISYKVSHTRVSFGWLDKVRLYRIGVFLLFVSARFWSYVPTIFCVYISWGLAKHFAWFIHVYISDKTTCVHFELFSSLTHLLNVLVRDPPPAISHLLSLICGINLSS